MSSLKQCLKDQKDVFRKSQSSKVLSLIDYYRNCESVQLPISPVLYVWDVRQEQYLYFSKNVRTCLNHSAQDLLSRGHEIVFDILHPEDAISFTDIIHNMIAFMRKLPIGTHQDYRMSYLLRVQAVNHYLRLLVEEAVLEVDILGNPLFTTGKISDVSYLNLNKGASLYVSKISQKAPANTSLCLYEAQSNLISQREHEVLNLLARGKTTNEIAEQLYISPNTVKNHRKNMLKKTGTSNTVALIRTIYGHH